MMHSRRLQTSGNLDEDGRRRRPLQTPDRAGLERQSEMTSRSNGGTIHEILGRDSVHPFPARMAPGLALDLVAECKKPLRVLNPMSGSGTVLAVARSKGHHAIGVDIDPLAVLISRVWTTPVDTEILREQGADALHHARSLFGSLQTRDAYPASSDAETRSFARYLPRLPPPFAKSRTTRSEMPCGAPSPVSSSRSDPGRRWPWISRTVDHTEPSSVHPRNPSANSRTQWIASPRIASTIATSALDRRRVYTKAMHVVSPSTTGPSTSYSRPLPI